MIVRKWVQVRIQQRVAIRRRKGIDHAQPRCPIGGRPAGTDGLNEIKRLFLAHRRWVALLKKLHQRLCFHLLLWRKRLHRRRLHNRLLAAQLYPEEIVLAQDEEQFFRCPIQQNKQLFVIDQMPVLADDGLVATLQPDSAHRVIGREAKQRSLSVQRGYVGFQCLREALAWHHAPVAPYHRLEGHGEMRGRERRLRVTSL